jgi:hypothetical protein
MTEVEHRIRFTIRSPISSRSLYPAPTGDRVDTVQGERKTRRAETAYAEGILDIPSPLSLAFIVDMAIGSKRSLTGSRFRFLGVKRCPLVSMVRYWRDTYR